MLSYRDLVSGLKQINLDANAPVIAHASLSAFGEVRGGAESVGVSTTSAVVSGIFLIIVANAVFTIMFQYL